MLSGGLTQTLTAAQYNIIIFDGRPNLNIDPNNP